MRKPVLVDRHIPRELKALWQKLVLQFLTTEQSRTDVYPIASDLIFIVPKLVLSHPLGKRKRTARRLYKAASQGQLGKAWRQLRAPPPVFIGPDQWNEALAKFTPHEKQEGRP